MIIELHDGPNDGQHIEVPDDFVEVAVPHPRNTAFPPSWYRRSADGVWRHDVVS